MRFSALAMIACLPVLATACSKSAPEAPANAVAAATPAATSEAPPPPAAADGPSIVGKWIDDENDSYTFNADGTAVGAGQVSMTGSWKADGEDRYAIDLNSPAGLAKGVACVSGDTMAAQIGDGGLTLLGRVGADGAPATPDTTVKCE